MTLTCIIEGCTRARPAMMTAEEWICPKHWHSIDTGLRAAHKTAGRRYRGYTRRKARSTRAEARLMRAYQQGWLACVEDAQIKAAMGAERL